MVAHRHDRAPAFGDEHARVAGQGAVARDQVGGLELPAFIVGNADLPVRDDAGREIEHEGRFAGTRGHRDAHRVGAEPPVGTAERRDVGHPRAHVDERDRHQPGANRQLAVRADAPEVLHVAQPDDRDPLGARDLDPVLGRLAPDHLPEAAVAFEGRERARAAHDADVAVGVQEAVALIAHVGRQHADAVTVVAAQVRLDETRCDLLRLGGLAAHAAQDRDAGTFEHRRGDVQAGSVGLLHRPPLRASAAGLLSVQRGERGPGFEQRAHDDPPHRTRDGRAHRRRAPRDPSLSRTGL